LTALTIGDTALAFTSSSQGGLLRWDLRGDAQIGASVGGDTGAVWSVASVEFADGAIALASGGADGRIHRWEPISGEELSAPIGNCGKPRAIASAVLGDGTTVLCTVSADGVLHRHDASSGDPIGEPTSTDWEPRRWRGRTLPWQGFVATVRCEGRDLVAVAEHKTSVQLWDIRSGIDAGTIYFPDIYIRGLAAARLLDGTPLLIVSDSQGRVHRIDPQRREPFVPAVYPQGRSAFWVLPTEVLDDRAALTVLGEMGARTYDRRTGELLAVAEGLWPSGQAYGVAIISAADGTPLLLGADEDGICRVDLRTGMSCPPTDAECAGMMWDVAAATLPDGRVIAGGAGHNGEFYRWDTATGEAVGEPLRAHPISIKAVASALSSGGTPMFITGCEAGRIQRWDAATGELIGDPLPGDVGFVTDLAVATTPDGRQYLACLNGKGLHRWDPATAELIGRPILLDSPWYSMFAYVDRRGDPSVFIVPHSNEAGSVDQWRLDTGERVRTGLPATLCAVFDLDGTEMMVLGAPDGSLTIRPLPPSAHRGRCAGSTTSSRGEDRSGGGA